MKRFKILSVAAFLFAFAAAIVTNAGVQQTTWVYEQSGQKVDQPDCSFAPSQVCAREHILNADGSLGAPTGQIQFGQEMSN